MVALTFKLAGLELNPDPLPTLNIELTEDHGFVLTFETVHPFSSQILEQCVIGNSLEISVGLLSTSGTVFSLENKENYAKIVLTDLLGIV
jgi:hypothetical protein